MKLRVILSLIVALFIGQSMYAMSNEVLRRPIILDGEIIEEGSRSINPLIPISADIDGSTLFIKFSKAIGNVDIAVKEITDAKKEVYSSSMDVNAAGQITSFSIADLTPGTYVLEFTQFKRNENYGPYPSFVQIIQFMLDLCYNEENFIINMRQNVYAIR